MGREPARLFGTWWDLLARLDELDAPEARVLAARQEELAALESIEQSRLRGAHDRGGRRCGVPVRRCGAHDCSGRGQAAPQRASMHRRMLCRRSRPRSRAGPIQAQRGGSTIRPADGDGRARAG